jgi:dTDP-4-amino-4,6-dideoxygalactose transaminase
LVSNFSFKMVNTNHLSYPNKERFLSLVNALYESEAIRENGWLTQELEATISERTGVKHVFFCANGTIALYLSLKALKCSGEVILSAYTPPATLDAVVLAGFTPVLCDVDKDHYGLCPESASLLINDRTRAILPTHIYGNVVAHDKLERLCRANDLALVYDISHGFGVSFRNKDATNYGDISAMSLQAFKVFSALEGGLIFTEKDELAKAVYQYRFFGKNADGEILSDGINGKGSDLHAAFALAHLPDVDSEIHAREVNYHLYRELLENTGTVTLFKYCSDVTPNFSYMPVFFRSESSLLDTVDRLKQNGVVARRYFYPALSSLNLDGVKQVRGCPVAEEVSERVLCLPIYPGLLEEDIRKTCQIILNENG